MTRWTRLTLCLAGAVLTGISCQNDNSVGPTDPGASEAGPALATTTTTTLAFLQVDAGLVHTCGVATDNRAYCWGSNKIDQGSGGVVGAGQLGDGTTADHNRPVAVSGGLHFRQVSAGHHHTCGVTMDYRAYCWGWNGSEAGYYGALGDGTTTKRLKPVPVAGGHQFRQVSAGYFSTCGVSYPDNRAYCWGSNWSGQLGDGTVMERRTPVAVAGTLRFRQVSTGGSHTCGTTPDNQAYCWGSNAAGMIGDSTTVFRRKTPTAVAGGLLFRQVSAGDSHTCGVTTDDRAFCWGSNYVGQIGDGKTTSSRRWPRAVIGALRFREVIAGSAHSCGQTTTNLGYCWGAFRAGELGDGDTSTQRWVPVAVAGGHQFRQLTAGGSAFAPDQQGHSCGRDLAQKAYCWGSNSWGQLGDGTTTTRLMPRAVVGPM
jgi:alpha-tubulin suppressor-like RCC1 family protein